MRFNPLSAIPFALLPLLAAAQTSSVELYGRIDLGINAIKYQGESGTRKTLSSDTSLFGLRGTEQLGGGLSAYFKLESGFQADTGTQSNATTFFNRESYVGLRDATLGAIDLGAHWSPFIFLTGKTDPFARAQTGAQLSMLQGSAVRGYTAMLPNSVQYLSPTLFGGLNMRLLVQMREDTPNKNLAASAEYTADRLYVGLATDRIEVARATIGAPGAGFVFSQTTGLGATYRFDGFKLFGYLQHNKVDTLASAKGYLLGLTVPAGSGEFRASWIQNQRATGDASLFAVGYAHNLSKRTMVYTSAALLDNSGASRIAMFPSSQDMGTRVPALGQDLRGIQVGVRHLF
ncbi:MAG: porin [Pseudomonadota bacterium]